MIVIIRQCLTYILNEQGLTIPDVNGNEVKVDFNPIKTDVTGTIDKYLENNSKIYSA